MAKKIEIKTKGGAHFKKNQYLDGLNHCCATLLQYSNLPTQPSHTCSKLDLAFYIVASHV